MRYWDQKSYFYYYFRRWRPLKKFLDEENHRLTQILPLVDIFSKSILDLGTGLGNALQIILERQRRGISQAPIQNQSPSFLVGLDYSTQMLCFARRKTQAEFVQGQALILPFKAEAFFGVLAVGIAEYVPDLKLFLIEINRILKKNGWLIITISPKNIYALLRIGLGAKLYFISMEKFEQLIATTGFRISLRSRSRMQIQYLIRKVD
ncbi:class I SAM-dependent methyltransferase [candidate division KSB1 bacterium]|nr:class I SAM-dependent methyltransferase [candidate division KSB1 bacterium]